ncbi:cell division protein ZapA [Candidatus Dependentiae bacterium]|nr:cell division protein ZapA [Candidatus Dependentiae bacterium]
MNNLKKVKVSIFGSSYTLISDENHETLQKAATIVDNLLKDTSKSIQSNDPKSLLTLVAINLASKLISQEEENLKILDAHQRLLDLINHQI